MALVKYKLGNLIEQRREKYDGYSSLPIRGVSRDGFIEAKQEDADISLYNVYYLNDFVFNPARMEINSIALNQEFDKGICSSLYEVFFVKDTEILLPEYLNFFIKRDEFARHCEFLGWGSAREYCRVNDISEIEILVPPIDIQKKYVELYKSMVNNQQSFERGIEEVWKFINYYIDSVIPKELYKPLGNYIEINPDRNEEGIFDLTNLRGFDDEGNFIPPARVFSGDIKTFRIIKKGDFVYNPRIPTTVFPVALNREDTSYLITPANTSFRIVDENKMNNEYLIMILQRDIFSKKVLFNTWGSSTPFLRHDDLCEITIPVPNVDVQNALSNMHSVYVKRKQINEQLKKQLKSICKVLYKGSIEEASV